MSLLDVKGKRSVGLAWANVGLRVAHSLIHVSTNNPSIRSPVWAASSVAVFGLTVEAAWKLLF